MNVVPPLALADPEDAAAVAETITDPDVRALALLKVIDALPDSQRDRKLALIDRAALAAKAGTDPRTGSFRWATWPSNGICSARSKARALFAQGRHLASQLPEKDDYRRGLFAARLARVDLPAALAIAHDFPARSGAGRNAVCTNIALHLAGVNPGEAEQALSQVTKVKGRYSLRPGIVWRMAAADPELRPSAGRGIAAVSRRPDNLPVSGAGTEVARRKVRGRGRFYRHAWYRSLDAGWAGIRGIGRNPWSGPADRRTDRPVAGARAVLARRRQPAPDR